MQRSQLLLTENLGKEVKKMAKAHKISQSEVVRRLLGQALALKSRKRQSHKQTQGSYLYDLDEFTESNPRTEGFKELYSVGAPITEVKVVGDEAFRYYLKHSKLPEDLEHKLHKAANSIKSLSETGKLVVRRAYMVPGLDNPPGPRFIGLKPGEVVNALIKLYDFAIEHEYFVQPESRIVAFFYPFADPKPITLPIKNGTVLPYGGYAVPLNKDATKVEVLGVWGNNEGVQSFDAIDRYIVNTSRMIIQEKGIPQKPVMLVTTRSEESAKVTVPLDKQFEQVLSDAEILNAARIIKELSDKYGLRRIEYSFDGKDSLEYNESAPYEIHTKSLKKIEKKGKILTVKSEGDVEKVRKLNAHDIKNTIIYIDKMIVENRSYDILNSIAGLPIKFTVLYPGLSATAHAMRVLSDFGHTALTVGNRRFKHGEEILIKLQKDNFISIEKVSDTDMTKYLVNLYDAKLYGKEKVGGKAFNLSLLKSKGFNVPHGVVLTTELFEESVRSEVSEKRFENLFASNSIDPGFIAELSNNQYSIPNKIWKDILKQSKFNKNMKYAIRSSATVEDQAEHSFAGQFTTHLNVKPDKIKGSVEDVIRSTFSERVAQYFSALGKKWSTKMAVVVQEMPKV
ncbi:MAG: PEP/pyruvate-binding domain-containing protein, partial [Candidatus Dojkabacteria bacterium]